MSEKFRMVEMQIRNMVNVGFSKNISNRDIRVMAESAINAAQLFLTENEILILKYNLSMRLIDKMQERNTNFEKYNNLKNKHIK